MPDMANLIVKQADDVTDVTFTKVQPSAGDSSPAVWRGSSSTIAGFNPELRMVARPSKDKAVRRSEVQFSYPHTVIGTDGVTRVTDTTRITCTVLTPQKVDISSTNEAVAQGLRLLASDLIKVSAQSGYAPS